MENKDFNIDFFESIKQLADLQFDKLIMEAVKDNPFMVALFKLLNEYGIHGLRAHEFIMRFGALGDLMNGGGKDD